jgi:hypothetical protein
MAAKNDSVPNGRIVPAIPATSQFAIKGKEEGRRELAFFFCTETSHAERAVSSFGVCADQVLDGTGQG